MRTFVFIIVLSVTALLLGCQPSPAPNLPAGGDFVLQTADGPLDSKRLRGKTLLIYFGYTQCPDICPMSLSAAVSALKTLSAQERAQVRLLMISVDPARDTVARLKEYAAFFHPEMVAATGAPAEIAALAKAFGAGYVQQPAKEDGSYAIDHTSVLYLVRPDGRLAQVIPSGAGPEAIVAAIRAHR